jgi:hypothetical protein
MAIDARENINAQIMLARSLGGDIGSALGYHQRKKRRERMELALIQIVGDANLNASQKRQALLMTSDLLESGIGEEALHAELEIGRYYQSPLDTEYKQARIDATKALTKSRTGDGNLLSQLKYWQDSLDKATMSGDQRMTKYATSRIDEILTALGQPGDMSIDLGMGSGAADTGGGGLPIGPPGSKADIMQGAFGRPNLTGPPASLQTNFPSGVQQFHYQRPAWPKEEPAPPKQPPPTSMLPEGTTMGEIMTLAQNLDEISKQELNQIIASGDIRKLKIALERMRKKYGTVQ